MSILSKIPTPKRRNPSRRGMMLPLVLLAVVLVSTFAYYFHNYRMMQVKMSSTIGNFYNALNVAEAGVSAAITEMATQFNWKTHQTSGTAGNTTFTAPVDHQNSITSGGILHSVSGTNGTYYGKIGDYGEFKVRVGLEKIAGDNPNTKTVNEEYMFYRIESIGKYGNAYQKVTVILQKKILSEEFLLYDNDFLDMVLGVQQTTAMSGDNIFNVGSLYGRRFVFLGTNQFNKPKLKIQNVSNISTAGGLYVWDSHVSIDGTPLNAIKNSSTLDYRIKRGGALIAPGSGNFYGQTLIEGQKPNDQFAANSRGGILKDANNGGRLEILNFEEIFPNFAVKAKHAGIFIDTGSSIGEADNFINPYPPVGTVNGLRYLDFGDMIDGEPDDEKALGTIPPNFNGIVYSMVPLRIRGCPDRDLVIVSEKDIYVCGDLNQASSVIQGYKDATLLEYASNPKNGQDYFKEDKQFRVDNPTLKHGLYRNRVKVISKQKIWYDYTRPDLAFENELKPFIEYELCRELTTKTKAFQIMQDLNKSANLTKDGASAMNTLLYKIWFKSTDSTVTEDSLLDPTTNPAIIPLYNWMVKPPTQPRPSNGEPRSVNSIYCSGYGGSRTATTAQRITKVTTFLKQKHDVDDGTGTMVPRSFIEMCSDGSLSWSERKALVDAIWLEMTTSLATDGEYSALWDLPARLYNETKPTATFSQFQNPTGAAFGNTCRKDRLMLPEMTLNAKFISADTRNGLWDIGKTTRAIYNELGNPKTSWAKPKNAGYFRYMPHLSGILRVLGGEIFLRLNKCEPKTMGEVYQPHVRKKVFDVDLIGFEDETAIPVYSVMDFSNEKVKLTEWNNF